MASHTTKHIPMSMPKLTARSLMDSSEYQGTIKHQDAATSPTPSSIALSLLLWIPPTTGGIMRGESSTVVAVDLIMGS